MRKWLAVVAAGSLLVLAGCGKALPAGVDGNLVDDWQQMPVPQQVQPQTGVCYENFSADLSASPVIDCSAVHLMETTFVGAFTGDAANLPSPPEQGSTALSAAYETCAAPTRAYLGGDWHSALLDLTISEPDGQGWKGGARWYRCSISHLTEPDATDASISQVSYKGALTSATGPLAATCINWTDHTTYVTDISVVTCAKPHNGEYVGYYLAPFGPYPSQKTAEKLSSDGCELAVAHYLGFTSVNQDFNSSVGWLTLGFDKTQWNMGDRSTRCYAAAYTKDGKFTASVKGIKNKTAKG
jgi:hypothetical protein